MTSKVDAKIELIRVHINNEIGRLERMDPSAGDSRGDAIINYTRHGRVEGLKTALRLISELISEVEEQVR